MNSTLATSMFKVSVIQLSTLLLCPLDNSMVDCYWLLPLLRTHPRQDGQNLPPLQQRRHEEIGNEANVWSLIDLLLFSTQLAVQLCIHATATQLPVQLYSHGYTEALGILRMCFEIPQATTSIACKETSQNEYSYQVDLYTAFRFSLSQKWPVRDHHLGMSVLVMVLLDIAILLVYMAVEGARGNLEATRVRNRENPDDVLGVSGLTYKYYRRSKKKF